MLLSATYRFPSVSKPKAAVAGPTLVANVDTAPDDAEILLTVWSFQLPTKISCVRGSIPMGTGVTSPLARSLWFRGSHTSRFGLVDASSTEVRNNELIGRIEAEALKTSETARVKSRSRTGSLLVSINVAGSDVDVEVVLRIERERERRLGRRECTEDRALPSKRTTNGASYAGTKTSAAELMFSS
jgi:hypothetical protein